MQLGNRIIYNQDGYIIHQTGDVQGNVLPRVDITSLDFVDLDYGAIDFNKHRIVRINPDTKQPILEDIELTLTPEEQRIRDLEDQLLLLADASTGGIL